MTAGTVGSVPVCQAILAASSDRFAPTRCSRVARPLPFTADRVTSLRCGIWSAIGARRTLASLPSRRSVHSLVPDERAPAYHSAHAGYDLQPTLRCELLRCLRKRNLRAVPATK